MRFVCWVTANGVKNWDPTWLQIWHSLKLAIGLSSSLILLLFLFLVALMLLFLCEFLDDSSTHLYMQKTKKKNVGNSKTSLVYIL